MAIGYIYKIVNSINDKVYVGQTTTTLNQRFTQHKSASLKYNTCLYNAMRKYGVKNFKIIQIDSADTLEELSEKEIYWIKKLNTKRPNGYNILDGGKTMKGYHHTKETKELLKLKSTGNHNALGKHKVTITGKENMSLAHKGKVSSFKNKNHSLEAKKQLSINHSKKVICVETNVTYPSSLIASQYLKISNHIGRCCNGERKTCGGYHWKWA